MQPMAIPYAVHFSLFAVAPSCVYEFSS